MRRLSIFDVARRLGLLARPGAGEKVERARAEIAARSAAEQFRSKRDRAFRGIVTHREVLRLYPVTRMEASRERLVAGQMARMDQEMRRQAARAREAARYLERAA